MLTASEGVLWCWLLPLLAGLCPQPCPGPVLVVCAVASSRDRVDHSFLITGGPAELISGLVGASLNLFCTLYLNPEYYWGRKILFREGAVLQDPQDRRDPGRSQCCSCSLLCSVTVHGEVGSWDTLAGWCWAHLAGTAWQTGLTQAFYLSCVASCLSSCLCTIPGT